MIQSLSPLVCSGRRPPLRRSGAPARLSADASHPIASLVVVGLALTLMLGPGIIAAASMFDARLNAPALDSLAPVHVMRLLDLARVLLTLVLVIKVMRTAEQA